MFSVRILYLTSVFFLCGSTSLYRTLTISWHLLICAIRAEGRDLMYHTTSVRTTHLSHWGLNICTEKMPYFSIQMTANKGLGIAYALSVMASPEIIGVHFWNFSFKFWIAARTGFWSVKCTNAFWLRIKLLKSRIFTKSHKEWFLNCSCIKMHFNLHK